MIHLSNVNKYFNKGKKNQLHVVNNTSLELGNNGLVSLLGPSGSGKTTLLNIIGGLDKWHSGSVQINGVTLNKRDYRKMDKIRNLNVGYVFQDYKLVDDLTVYANVALSLKMCGLKDKEEIQRRVNYVLNVVDLYRYRNRVAGSLSGGERQRVGIARAIVKNPNIIICDEPTGNLDSKNTLEIMNIIKSLSKERLVILVTHETELAEFYADRIIKLEDGKIIDDYQNKDIDELNYQVDNKIYLKDMQNDVLENSKVKVNCYFDEDTKIKDVTLVVKGDKVFVKYSGKVEVLDSDSPYELLNNHYKKLDKSIYLQYEFKMEPLNDKKYTSVYTTKSMLKAGINKVKKYTFIKKVMIGCFGLAGIFLMYAFASLFALGKVSPSEFVQEHESYVRIITRYNNYDDLVKLKEDNNVNYILPGNSIVQVEMLLDKYYQTADLRAITEGSLASVSLLDENKLVKGVLPKHRDEIVIDKMLYKRFLKSEIDLVGIKEFEELIGQDIKLYNKIYHIVGITDLESPSLYVLDNELINIVNGGLDSMFIADDEGKYDIQDGEVYVPRALEDTYMLGSIIDEKISKRKLKVVGYYDDNDSDKFLVNSHELEAYVINKNNVMLLSIKDKDILNSSFITRKYESMDLYKAREDEYLGNKYGVINRNFSIAIVMLLVTFLEMFFVIRSSFMSRIKEVGIYRAIGLKKIDIYKMFAGEILVVSTIGGVLGVLFMYGLLDALVVMDSFRTSFVVNPLSLSVTLIVMYLFNLFAGLLPVMLVVQKSPAEILSRHDI